MSPSCATAQHRLSSNPWASYMGSPQDNTASWQFEQSNMFARCKPQVRDDDVLDLAQRAHIGHEQSLQYRDDSESKLLGQPRLESRRPLARPPNDYSQYDAVHRPSSSEDGHPPPQYSDIIATTDSAEAVRYETSAALAASPGPSPPMTEDEILRQALQFTNRRHDSKPSTTTPLQRPVVIPQSAPAPGSPFSRAYAPALEEHGIGEADFLEFLDNLNIVSASNPGLSVLGGASGMLGMVPIHHAQLLALGVQAAVKVGHVALMKTRGALFIKESNENFFQPHGLKVGVVTSDVLRERVGLLYNRELVAPVQDSADYTALQRKMAALNGYVQPLRYDVPPASAPTTTLARLSAKQQSMQLRSAEKKAQKNRIKISPSSDHVVSTHTHLPDGMSKLNLKTVELAEKRDRKLQKAGEEQKASRRAREEAKAHEEYEKDMERLEKEKLKSTAKHNKGGKHAERKGKDKEAQDAEKLHWIIIESCR